MKKYVVIDLETTGSEISNRMIEIGIVIIENKEIVGDYATFINPNQNIPSFISHLTGITDADVKNAPYFEEKAEEILDLLKDSYIIAHNIHFDLGFLNDELQRIGKGKLQNPVIDTVELSRIFYPQAPSYKLNQLAQFLNIKHKAPHRAISDAYVTAHVFLNIQEKIASLPYETIQHLLNFSGTFSSNIDHLLEEQLKGRKMTEQLKGMAIYDGIPFKDVKQDHDVQQRELPSFGAFLEQIYGQNGLLKERLTHFEHRPGQQEMSEHIYDAFQVNEHLLIEAQTGMGKTIAYLIPAIYEAVTKAESVVISTYTNQLQEQLVEKELSLLKEILPFSIHIAVLKGKQHYLSLERFSHALKQSSLDNYEISLTKAMILIWITETNTGDIDELSLSSGASSFLKQISASHEVDIPKGTPSYFHQAFERAKKADLIVTNHAQLCASLSNPKQLFPTFQRIIIDEAHQLERVVTKQFGYTIHYAHIQYVLNQLGMVESNGLIRKMILDDHVTDHFYVRDWNISFQHVKEEIDDIFRVLYRYVLNNRNQEQPMSDTGKVQLHINSSLTSTEGWQAIQEMVRRLVTFLKRLTKILQHILEQIDPINGIKQNVQHYQAELDNVANHFTDYFLTKQEERNVKWLEIDLHAPKHTVYIYKQPLSIHSLLTESLFIPNRSVILTSGTLTMNDSFCFIKKQLGLENHAVRTHILSSPFNYEDKVRVLIPNDFPDIQKQTEDFIYATCEAILSLTEITEGRMLILFTSYDMLNNAHQILKEALEDSKFTLLSQGITSGSRFRLKKLFQTTYHAILLGTNSFWEGVDISGQSLSSLVIVRLPFERPTHPIFEAKAQQTVQSGGNAFYDLALPQAVLRFKQGFGRLIRSSVDRGIIFICDSRIYRASYGKYFLKSIPKVPITYASTYELLDEAEKWF